MKRIALLLPAAMLCVPLPAAAWQGKVARVNDGDTVTVQRAAPRRSTVTVRLYGIDAPELAQDFGRQAAHRLAAQLPVGTPVDVDTQYTDPHGRDVAVLKAGNVVINERLIASGSAWVFSRYCKAPFCRQWRALEKKARAARLGLWREGKPMPPWTWRRLNPRRN